MSTPPDAATGLTGPPKIERLETMRVVGIHRPMSFGGAEMRELWGAFRPRVREILGRAHEGFVSMRVFEKPLSDAPGPGVRFEQWAAVEVTQSSQVPRGMDLHTLAGGRYAVFRYRGRASDFDRAGAYIYREWLPDSPYELDHREHFEILGPAYRPDDPHATEEVWIPVRRRGTGGRGREDERTGLEFKGTAGDSTHDGSDRHGPLGA